MGAVDDEFCHAQLAKMKLPIFRHRSITAFWISADTSTLAGTCANRIAAA